MLIDAHSHLDRYCLTNKDLLGSALEEIIEHKIFTISNSMDLPSHKQNLAIAEKCNLVLPIFGVHPWTAPQYAHHLEDLRDATVKTPMIGEIGLDHYFVEDKSQYPDQKIVFEYFLTAAVEQSKTIIIHTKGAEEEILDLLVRYDIPPAIIHWYSGPLDIFRDFKARGDYFTIGVEVLYSEHIQAILKEIPLTQLLTETDNPGGPKAFIGELGMPILIKKIVMKIAELKNTTFETITQTVQTNLLRLNQDAPGIVGAYYQAMEEYNADPL